MKILKDGTMVDRNGRVFMNREQVKTSVRQAAQYAHDMKAHAAFMKTVEQSKRPVVLAVQAAITMSRRQT